MDNEFQLYKFKREFKHFARSGFRAYISGFRYIAGPGTTWQYASDGARVKVTFCNPECFILILSTQL